MDVRGDFLGPPHFMDMFPDGKSCDLLKKFKNFFFRLCVLIPVFLSVEGH